MSLFIRFHLKFDLFGAVNISRVGIEIADVFLINITFEYSQPMERIEISEQLVISPILQTFKRPCLSIHMAPHHYYIDTKVKSIVEFSLSSTWEVENSNIDLLVEG